MRDDTTDRGIPLATRITPAVREWNAGRPQRFPADDAGAMIDVLSRAGFAIVPSVWGNWQPIETAPKSTSTATPSGSWVKAVYLLGFCPEEGFDLAGCIEVIWWEPHLDGGRWQSSADVPITPTHWMPLPAPPTLPTKEPGA